MPEREDTGFKVTDRRKFKADGSPREDAEIQDQPVAAESRAADSAVAEPKPPQANDSEPAAGNVISFPGEAAAKRRAESASPAHADIPAGDLKAAGQAPTPEQTAAEQAYNQARGPQSPRMPEASFLGLVNMLGVEAAMHMGLIHSSGEETPSVDLESARHLIDMLGILQTKTRDNVTAEEDGLFEGMLADLRMQFVALSRRR
jgi:hypothetical protein